MTTPAGDPGTRRWRSRAFVQPLLITAVGVWANIAIYLVAVSIFNPRCPDASCGLLHYEINLLMSGALLLFLPLVGMIITGWVVGQKGPRSGLAGGAILVGMAIVWLSLMVLTQMDVTLSSVVSVVSLILVGLGFVLGRRGRPSPNDQSDATGRPEDQCSGCDTARIEGARFCAKCGRENFRSSTG